MKTTLIVATACAALLAIGAVYDLYLGIAFHTQEGSFCSWLRIINTASNDLLAMVLLFSDVYLWIAFWVPAKDYFQPRDMRLLFLACAIAALFSHLFLLQLLHNAGIQGIKI